jgi:hypothetical protein
MNKKQYIRHLIEQEIRALLKEEIEAKVSTFEEDPLNYILKSYPTLRETLIMLMSKAYKDAITGIYILAYKPTTFKVVLHNGQEFLLTYLGRAYEATVQARRYYLMTIGEKESAVMAIRDLLLLGAPLNAKGPGEELSSTAGMEGTPQEGEAGGAEGEPQSPEQEKEEETES